jgi:hypothetical protein
VAFSGSAIFVSLKVSEPEYKKAETKLSVCCRGFKIDVVEIQGVVK